MGTSIAVPAAGGGRGPGSSRARSTSAPAGSCRRTWGRCRVGVLLALFMFGIGKAALMPFHRWLPAAMVAPTPVSALLHAVAVVKAGVFTVVKVVVYVFGLDALAGAAPTGWSRSRLHAPRRLAGRAALRQSQAPARLLDGEPARPTWCSRRPCWRRCRSSARRMHIAAHALRQDHAVLRCRLDLHRGAQDRGQRARRHRPADAVDDGGVRRRRAVDDRAAAGGRLRQQVVHARRCGRRRALGGGRGDRRRARCSTPGISCRSCIARSSARRAADERGTATARRRCPSSSR